MVTDEILKRNIFIFSAKTKSFDQVFLIYLHITHKTANIIRIGILKKKYKDISQFLILQGYFSMFLNLVTSEL